MTLRPLTLSVALLAQGFFLAAGAGAGPVAATGPAPAKAEAATATRKAGATAAGTPAAALPAPRVTGAWIAEAPPTARHNAAYLVLRNGGRPDTLLGVATPVAEVVELHEMRMDGGVMRMRQERSVELAAGAELRLAPGGRHLMLVGMKRGLQSGERIPLTLRFRRAGDITVMAEVRPLVADTDAGDMPAHSGHHAH